MTVGTFCHDSQASGTGLPYGYDKVGNVLKVIETYTQSGVSSRTVSNTYDYTYRLKTETASDSDTRVTGYTYDKANNRTRKVVSVNNVPTTDLTYTLGDGSVTWNSNQLAGYGPTGGAQSRIYAYDLNGNRSGVSYGGSTDVYVYDDDNRLRSLNYQTAATPAVRGIYAQLYDHRTRRVQKSQLSLVTNVSFSGGTSVQERNGTTVTRQYVRGSDYGGGIGGILYSMGANSTAAGLSFSEYNSRGDVIGQTSATAIVTWQAAYEAFGTRVRQAGTTPATPQRANTKDEDPTGLLNEGFRYRDLETGVFITRDPLGFVDGPNVYTYVNQNPWTHFDPDGLARDLGSDGKFHPEARLYRVNYDPKDPKKTSYKEVSARDIKKKNALIWVNGMNNDRDNAGRLGANHTGSNKFYMIHNPSNGGLADFGECFVEKLGFNTKVATTTAEILRNFDLKTAKIVAHSQGTMILSDALRQLNQEGVGMAGMRTELDGSAAHTPRLSRFLTSVGAEKPIVTGHALDPVHNIVGMNSISPARIVGSTVAVPLVFMNPNLSSHTTKEGGKDLPEVFHSRIFR